MVDYPTQLDEIDQWLADNFGILPGACASTENLRHTTARMIAEALWPKCKESLHIPETSKENGDSFTDEIDSKKASGDSINSNDLEEAAEKIIYDAVASVCKTDNPRAFCQNNETVFNVASSVFHKVQQLRNSSAITSQELEEAAERLAEHIDEYGDPYPAIIDAFKAGASWQREQDKETIELAEDHAMLAGMVKKEEEMKKGAIERIVKEDAGGYPYIDEIELYDYDKDEPTAKKGDKVGVYIFKN